MINLHVGEILFDALGTDLLLYLGGESNAFPIEQNISVLLNTSRTYLASCVRIILLMANSSGFA